VVVSITYSATYLYSLTSGRFDTGFRDLAELARYPIILLFSVFLLKARQLTARETILHRCIVPSVYISAILLIIYAAKVPVLCDALMFLYGGSKSAINPAAQWISWTLPFENPNFLGLYMVWCLVCILFFTPKTRPISTVLCVLMVFLSGSRTAWVAGGLVMVTWNIGALLAGDRRRDVLGIAGGLLVGAVFLVAVLGIDLTRLARVQLITSAIGKGNILLEPNLAARISQTRFLIARVLGECPLLGFGPSKYAVADVIDSQYVLWLTRAGLVGTVLLAWFYSWLALWRPLLYYIRRHEVYLALGAVSFSVATLVSLLTGPFLDNLRLLFLGGAMLILVIANPTSRRRTANDRADVDGGCDWKR
jgi:hypothetical protein